MTSNTPTRPLFQTTDDHKAPKKRRPDPAAQEANAGMLLAMGGNAYRGIYVLLRGVFRLISRRK